MRLYNGIPRNYQTSFSIISNSIVLHDYKEDAFCQLKYKEKSLSVAQAD